MVWGNWELGPMGPGWFILFPRPKVDYVGLEYRVEPDFLHYTVQET